MIVHPQPTHRETVLCIRVQQFYFTSYSTSWNILDPVRALHYVFVPRALIDFDNTWNNHSIRPQQLFTCGYFNTQVWMLSTF